LDELFQDDLLLDELPLDRLLSGFVVGRVVAGCCTFCVDVVGFLVIVDSLLSLVT
jgi:hypothetical protein